MEKIKENQFKISWDGKPMTHKSNNPIDCVNNKVL